MRPNLGAPLQESHRSVAFRCVQGLGFTAVQEVRPIQEVCS